MAQMVKPKKPWGRIWGGSPVALRQSSTTTTQKTLNTLGVEESSPPRRVLHFQCSDSSGGRTRALQLLLVRLHLLLLQLLLLRLLLQDTLLPRFTPSTLRFQWLSMVFDRNSSATLS